MSIKVAGITMWGTTNSSSTHTVIRVGSRLNDRSVPEDFSFGWDRFVLASKESKMMYLAALVAESLSGQYPAQVIIDVIKALFGFDLGRTSYGVEASIDHQSLVKLPFDFDGDLHRGFLAELREYLLQDGIVILGGNDNSDPDREQMVREYDGSIDEIYASLPKESGKMIARKDPVYNYWVLYNPATGARIRMSFNEDIDTSRSSLPETVDIKITNFCNIGCPYCYQSSTPEGSTAENLWTYSRLLSEMQVFEVAIGGGEPTFSRLLWTFLAHCHDYGMYPTFTTRSLAWMKIPRQRDAFNLYCGRFAYSVSTNTDAANCLEAMEQAEIDKNKVVFQYVLGSTSIEEFDRLLRYCERTYSKLLLLGYKDFGFGSNWRPHPHEEWLDIVRDCYNDHRYSSWIGVDSEVVRQFEEQIRSIDTRRIFSDIREGNRSMYIDAVQSKVGPSSYTTELVDARPLWVNQVIDLYRGFS